MKNIRNIISMGILAAVLGYANPAKADFISGEVFGNDKGALLEVKGSVSSGTTPNVQYFTRVRRFRGYDGKNTSFMQNELSFGDWCGVRVVGQGRLVGELLVPQAGISYSTKMGDAGSFYAALTSSVQKEPIGELLMYGVVLLDKKIPLELEQIVSGNENIFKGSTRAHVGYQFGPITLGVAGEADYGRNVPFVPKIGMYARLKSK